MVIHQIYYPINQVYYLICRTSHLNLFHYLLTNILHFEGGQCQWHFFHKIHLLVFHLSHISFGISSYHRQNRTPLCNFVLCGLCEFLFSFFSSIILNFIRHGANMFIHNFKFPIKSSKTNWRCCNEEMLLNYSAHPSKLIISSFLVQLREEILSFNLLSISSIFNGNSSIHFSISFLSISSMLCCLAKSTAF